MSEIILNWLNEEIQLSKRITHFQEDFSNGYLLGELLSKYNQQLNFNDFLDKDDKKSKLKNFQLLFDTFASLRVAFNSSLANQIINKKSGIAKKLLYELKMNLEKTNSNAFTKLTKITKTLSPLKKIKVSKQQYDKVDKQHFVKQLNELHPAQKTLNQQKLLKRFSDFHENQVSVNNQLADKDMEQKFLEHKKFRQRQRQNLKKTADFRNEWQRSNMEKWQTNMTVRHMQQQKDSMFRTKLDNTKVQNKTMSELNAIKLLDKDINEFERKFIKGANKKKNVIEDSDDSGDDVANNTISEEPELKKQESKLSSKLKFTSTGNPQLSFDSPSKKKKATAQVPEQQKHQRQKKRRKMIVQQNKRYQLIEVSRRQKYILSTIQQTSKQEKELQYEIWRVWQNKEIIKENKNLEEDKVREKTEVRQINSKFKREELLKTYREEHEAEVKEACLRQDKLIKDNQVAQRKQVYSQCKDIVEQFINVAEKCFLAQQQNNQDEISKNLLDHLFSEFVEGTQSTEDVAKLQVDNYIHGRGEWNLLVKRKTEDQPTDPALDNALPNKITNNYVLGNTLRFLYENKFSVQNVKNGKEQIGQASQSQPKPEYVFSLLGLEFAGKHLAAEELSRKHNFTLIEIEKLILRKLHEYEEIKDKVTEISSTTKQLVQLAYGGKDIPNELIIELVKEEITKNPRSILLNFPTTYNQALELTKTLADVQPSDFIRKSSLQQRIQTFSRLVWPTESRTVPKPVKECGVDLALWIDINEKTSYDRFLGRRWIDGKVVHISDDIADQVNKLEVRDKASPQIYKNYEKKVQKNNLEQFFNEFGIQLNPEQKKPEEVEEFREGEEQKVQKGQVSETRVMKSWSIVDGQCSIEQLQKQVLKKFESTIELKKLKKQELGQEEEARKQELGRAEQRKKLEEETKEKCVFSGSEQIQGKLSEAVNSVELESEFVVRTLSMWQTMETSTINPLTHTFKFLSSQQKQQENYFSSTKRNFINLLTREDKKFSIVKEFQINYNKFFDENKEMISQEYTKEELHQRVDDLQEALFDIIEMKKQDAMEEKKSTNESGWIESQLEQFYNCVRILLQAELNRYNGSEKILNDFYSKKYAVPQQPFEEVSTQIAYDSSLEVISKEGTFPRLQKLISEAMRIFNKEEEVVDDKNKKGGKAPPAGKKDDKKGGKKNEVEQVKQPTPSQLQLKRAINIQKSIFRYRLSIINEFSQRKMLALSKANESLFKDLDSYYLYTYDIENKCVSNLARIFRDHIEHEHKIQNQVQVNYVDIVENMLIRNFEQQKPVVLPAKQLTQNDRFTIAHIWELIHFIQHEAEAKEKISTKRLLQLFSHLQNNQNEKELFPANWKLLTSSQLENFALKLDIEQTGNVLLWRIFIFVVMSNLRLPSQKELENYINELTAFGTHLEISKQKMVSTAAWFDQAYEERENVRTFRRNEQVKEIMFEIMKHESKGVEWVSGEGLRGSLGLEWWSGKVVENGETTYFEAAFQ